MKELTKATKRKLRELLGLAYERALSKELAKLESEFVRWRTREIDAFKLSHLIHEFHDGAARHLYGRFVRDGALELTIARVLLDGDVTEEEAGPEVLTALARVLSLLREEDARQ